MSRSIRPVSPFPPRTGLQNEIDALIERLVELRSWDACVKPSYDDNEADLLKLADLAKSAALAMDPLFQRIAVQAGFNSMSGASPFVGLVSAGIEDDLLAGIAAKIAKIEDERGGESQETRDRREHSTLNHRHLGLERLR